MTPRKYDLPHSGRVVCGIVARRFMAALRDDPSNRSFRELAHARSISPAALHSFARSALFRATLSIILRDAPRSRRLAIETECIRYALHVSLEDVCKLPSDFRPPILVKEGDIRCQNNPRSHRSNARF